MRREKEQNSCSPTKRRPVGDGGAGAGGGGGEGEAEARSLRGRRLPPPQQVRPPSLPPSALLILRDPSPRSPRRAARSGLGFLFAILLRPAGTRPGRSWRRCRRWRSTRRAGASTGGRWWGSPPRGSPPRASTRCSGATSPTTTTSTIPSMPTTSLWFVAVPAPPSLNSAAPFDCPVRCPW